MIVQALDGVRGKNFIGVGDRRLTDNPPGDPPMNARDLRREAMRIGGESVHRDRVIDVFNPYTRAAHRHRAEGDARGRPPRLRDRQGLQAQADALRARGDPEQGRGDHPQPPRRVLRPHHRRMRPVQEGLAVRDRPRQRRAAVRRQRGAEGRRPDLLLRPDAARQEAPRLHPARPAARRHLRDHAVQPPDEPGGAQGRARPSSPTTGWCSSPPRRCRSRRSRSPTCSTRRACRRRCTRSSPATRRRSPTS